MILGLQLLKLHPDVAGRTCGDCQKWRYDDGARVGGRRLKGWNGKPIERTPGEKPPCRRCPKIPTDAPPFPAHAAELSEKNYTAYRFHLECRAVREFPSDRIVWRHAGIIEEVLENIRDGRQRTSSDAMVTMLQLSVKR